MTGSVEDPGLDCYPIFVIQDRYGGIFSGGKWVAIANGTGHDGGESRVQHYLGIAHGDNVDAMTFWAEPPDWVASADTPNEAVNRLLAKKPSQPANGW